MYNTIAVEGTVQATQKTLVQRPQASVFFGCVLGHNLGCGFCYTIRIASRYA